MLSVLPVHSGVHGKGKQEGESHQQLPSHEGLVETEFQLLSQDGLVSRKVQEECDSQLQLPSKIW